MATAALQPHALPPIGEPVPDGQKRYVHLRGHPRSGTNWLGRVLDLHPRIACGGELHLHLLQQALDRYKDFPAPMVRRKELMQVAQRKMQELIRSCIRESVADRPEALWVCDRTPSALRMLLPASRALLIIRDGRDVAVSWTFHQMRGVAKMFAVTGIEDEMRPLVETFKADPQHFEKHPEKLLANETWVREMGRRWSERVGNDLNEMERLNAGGTPNRVLHVRYEALHADVEKERAKVYSFLDLDPAEANAVDAGDDTKPGLEREDPSHYRRKGVVGDWETYFTDQAKAWFKEEAGPTLERLGYTQGNDW